MLPQCSHITRKRGRFYYRRRLPNPHIGEVVLALRTVNYREAEHLARVVDSAFARFLDAHMEKDLDEKLRGILQETLSATLKQELQRHQQTPATVPLYDTWRGHAALYGMTEASDDVREGDLKAIDQVIAGRRFMFAERVVEYMADWAKAIAKEYGLPQEAFAALKFGLAQIDLQKLEKGREWLIRGPVEQIELPTAQSLAMRDDKGNKLDATSPTKPLSELLPSFLEFMTTEEGWRGQTLAQNKATYRMFMAHCGDRAPRQYARSDLTSFYDTLRQLPAAYSRSPELRGLPPAEIIERTRGQTGDRLTMETVKRHFSALGRLFSYLKRRGETHGENPAHGFEFPQKGRANGKRKMWEGERLTKLFASPVWTGCKSQTRRSTPGELIIRDDKFWLPILGLYHGNRLEEFAQLRREDIRRDNGIWYFDINDEGERQTKNEQSNRRVPVHPRVIELGFLRYIEQAAPKATDLVFPDLRPGGPDNKLGFYFTKWWSRYRQDIGVYEKGLDYHSFRHGVTTKLYAAGLSDAIVDELAGHEGQGTSRAVYKKEMPLRVLAEAMSKIEWPEICIPGQAENLQKICEHSPR